MFCFLLLSVIVNFLITSYLAEPNRNFAFEFTRKTTQVPELASKEIDITIAMSLSFWFKVPSDSSSVETLITIPRNLKNKPFIQTYLSGNKLYMAYKLKENDQSVVYVPMGNLQKWTHVCITIREEYQEGITSTYYNFYVNGNHKKWDQESTDKPFQQQPFKGIVLGNDIDGSDINDVDQGFLGTLTELFIFNSVLSAEDVKNIYKHQIPTKNRVISWEEFRGTSEGTDVIEIDNPFIAEPNWDFSLAFIQQTTDSPQLPNKEILITDGMTISFWLKVPQLTSQQSSYEKHMFTLPRNDDHSIIQCWIQQGKLHLVYKVANINSGTAEFFPLSMINKWTHVCIAIQENYEISGNTRYTYYINGKILNSTISTVRLEQPPDGKAYKGIILGNDVDKSVINEVDQGFLGTLTEFFIFNSVMSAKDVKNIYHHQISTRNRVVSWEEFRETSQGTDVLKIDNPFIADFVPNFHESRPFVTGNLLRGCVYASKVNFYEHGYILMNGTVRLNISVSSDELEDACLQDKCDYTFPNVSLHSNAHRGTFQCVLFDPNLMLKPAFSKASPFISVNDPILLTQPALSHYDLSLGGSFRIIRCKHSFLNPESGRFVWYHNGFPRKPPTTDSIPIEMSTVEDIGFYQCALVLSDGSVILSDPVHVQFSDVSFTGVDIHLKKKYISSYQNSSSDEYVGLEKEVITKLKITLQEIDDKKQPKIIVNGFKSGSVIVSANIMYGNYSGREEKQQICQTTSSFLEVIKQGVYLDDVTSVEVNHNGCCPVDKIGEELFKGIYHYKATAADIVVTLPCKYNSSKNLTRQCKNAKGIATWAPPTWDNCPAKSPVTNGLIDLSKVSLCSGNKISTCESTVKVSSTLSTLVNDSNAVTTPEDVELIAEIIKNVIDGSDDIPLNKTTKITDNIFDCVNTLLSQNNDSSIAASQRRNQSSTSIIKSLNKAVLYIGKQLNGTKQNYTVSKQKIAAIIEYNALKRTTVFAQKYEEHKIDSVIVLKVKSDDNDFGSIKSLAKVQIPPEAFANESRVIYSIFYKSDALLMSPERLRHLKLDEEIVSNILKVSIGSLPIVGLTDPVLSRFKKIKQADGTVSCVFWNSSLATNLPNVFGKWSNRGCVVDKVASTESETACKCNHMTNFAIMMDVSQTFESPLELEIMTWIGCVISLVALFLTVLTYLLFPDLRKKLPTKILICLCFSLMALLIVFLAGAKQTKPRLSCQVIAALIQFLLLSTFCWMAVEGVNLYRNFVKIFGSGGTGRFLLRASIFAWGLPLLIVIITAIAEPANLGNKKFCVVIGNSSYFGIVLPVGIVLFGNFVILVMVMRSLSSSDNRQHRAQEESLKRSVRVAFGTSVLLGTTWIFALLAIGDLRLVFQWLFTIFNAFQGLFIFVFFTVRNNEAIKEWRKVMKCSFRKHHHSSPTENQNLSILPQSDGKHHSSKSNING